MGQRDYCFKRYFSDETRFADLINGVLGEGQQLISPRDLTDMDSQVGYRGEISASEVEKDAKEQFENCRCCRKGSC